MAGLDDASRVKAREQHSSKVSSSKHQNDEKESADWKMRDSVCDAEKKKAGDRKSSKRKNASNYTEVTSVYHILSDALHAYKSGVDFFCAVADEDENDENDHRVEGDDRGRRNKSKRRRKRARRSYGFSSVLTASPPYLSPGESQYLRNFLAAVRSKVEVVDARILDGLRAADEVKRADAESTRLRHELLELRLERRRIEREDCERLKNELRDVKRRNDVKRGSIRFLNGVRSLVAVRRNEDDG